MRNPRGETVAILQARTSSSRLPGKVLKDLAGKPMILRQLERISRAQRLDGIVVATSTDASDDILAELVTHAGYPCVRGPLDDVLARYIKVIDEYQPDVVVRLTADCPLTSATVIDQVVDSFHASNADYVSNTMIPTYPDGLDVEVVTAEALRRVADVSTDPHEREHVTLGVYRRPQDFAIENYSDPLGSDYSELRWTVDTQDDLDFVQTVYEKILQSKPTFEYSDLLTLITDFPQLRRTLADTGRNVALNGLDTGVMQHHEEAAP